MIDFVPQYQERHSGQTLDAQKLIQRVLGLWNSLYILCIDKVDNAVAIGEILRSVSESNVLLWLWQRCRERTSRQIRRAW